MCTSEGELILLKYSYKSTANTVDHNLERFREIRLKLDQFRPKMPKIAVYNHRKFQSESPCWIGYVMGNLTL